MRRALERRPDSTLFASCAAQLLVFGGSLGAAERVLCETAVTGSRCVCAAETHLHFLERHMPSELAKHANATIRLLEADPISRRGSRTLHRLSRQISSQLSRQLSRQVSRQVSRKQSANRTHERVAAAAEELTFEKVLGRAAASVELRYEAAAGWEFLTWLLRHASEPPSRDHPREPLGKRAAAQTHWAAQGASLVVVWWRGVFDWWPQACFQVGYWAGGKGALEERRACAHALVAALLAGEEDGGTLVGSSRKALADLLN